MKFEVELVYKFEQEAYVMARQLEVSKFSLSASSRLEGAPIRPSL